MEIYYNIQTKALERSVIKDTSFNQTKLLGLILVTYPFIKIVNSMMENIGIEARIFVWIISTLIGSLTGYIVKRTIYQDIELIPISMDKDQFEEFYQATQKPLTIVNWFMILSVLAQFIESFVYLIFGIFMVDFIYLLNTLVLTLLLLSGVHLRWKIFREIKHFFMS